jgi:periplasmic protein TonB
VKHFFGAATLSILIHFFILENTFTSFEQRSVINKVKTQRISMTFTIVEPKKAVEQKPEIKIKNPAVHSHKKDKPIPKLKPAPKPEKRVQRVKSAYRKPVVKQLTPPHKQSPDKANLKSEHAGHIIQKAMPVYKQNPRPTYPKLAKRRGYQGTATLEVLVNAGGRVDDVRLFSTSGYRILDTAAINSVKKWVFKPAMEGNKKIQMWVKVPVRFNLK